jgi:hypothetical protein
MAFSTAAGIAVCTLGLVACGGGGRAVEINPQDAVVGTRWNASLATPAGLVGASQVGGTGWMAQRDGDPARTRASVSVENAVPGGYINVHASPNNMGTIIACGNLAPPIR